MPALCSAILVQSGLDIMLSCQHRLTLRRLDSPTSERAEAASLGEIKHRATASNNVAAKVAMKGLDFHWT